MIRTTPDDVKAIMDNCTLEDDVIDPYITTANTLINEVFGTGTSSLLSELERWLTAHLITVTRLRQADQMTVGQASIKYAGKFGEGLSSTTYGQMVMRLDTTGKLAQSSKPLASMYAIKSFDE
jgi:hypothetical protein